MTENSAFSSSGVDAIAQTVDLAPQPEGRTDELSLDEFELYYDIHRTADEITKNGWSRIALQFPDELLHASVPVFRALKRRIGKGQELYVLADTSYGSCCVDEVAASHVDAEAVVHYGRACLTRTSRLPVLYVFGRKPLDIDDSIEKLADQLSSLFFELGDEEKKAQKILLRSDVAYAYCMQDMHDRLKALLPNHDLSYTPLPTSTIPTSAEIVPQATSDGSLVTSIPEGSTPPSDSVPEMDSHEKANADKTILYVGAESASLTRLLLTHSASRVFSYDASTQTARAESVRTNKLLQRRYYLLHAARDAGVFGLLVGTLGASSYLPLLAHLRRIIKRAGRKSYTVCVGKLNPAKLGNFAEVQAWVLVACPEGSLVDSKDFPAPIVTPYELQLALAPEPEWTGRYVLDFETLLAEGNEEGAATDGGHHDVGADGGEPHFSLITGTYRSSTRPALESDSDTKGKAVASSTDVVLRNQDSALAKIDSAAGGFLQQRSWQGLEQRLGEDAPSLLEQGRSGIARGYGEDKGSE